MTSVFIPVINQLYIPITVYSSDYVAGFHSYNTGLISGSFLHVSIQFVSTIAIIKQQ